MSRETVDFTYGNLPAFPFEVLRPGVDGSEPGMAPRITIDEARYHQALEDINKTFRVYEDEQTGKHFEIAIANISSTEETTDAEQSTFSSSLSNNIGNAIEFAVHAASHPNRRRIYIATYGNGGTSYWDAKEQAYLKETGRFTQPDGSPLPTVAALGRVLMRNDLTISRLSADSAGGAYATALMAALPEGQVTHAYLKSRPNITNHRLPLVWGASMQLGENRDKRRMEKVSTDPWFKTPALRAAAQVALVGIYGGKDGTWTMRGAMADSGLQKIITDSITLSHAGARYDHPAAKDTLAALAHQGDAKLTYHFPVRDRTYGRHLEQGVHDFLTQLAVSRVDAKHVEALIVPGSHLDHGPYPTMRASIEAYAFSR